MGMNENEQIKQLREYVWRLRTHKHLAFQTNMTLLNQAADAIEALSVELEQYRAIGTPEECRAAMEKQRAKKPSERQVGSNALCRKIYNCPVCGKKLYDCAIKNGILDHVSKGSKKSRYCECGQALSWEDENETD